MSTAFAQAQQLHVNGQLDAALALYEECLRDTPDDWRALTRLGLLRVQQGRFELAEAPLRRALALNPSNAEAHTWLGEALRNDGRLEASIESFRQALRVHPDFAPASFNLGLALAAAKDPAAAKAAWATFLELRPGDARVRRELASLALEQGDVEEAASWLGQHLERFASDSGAAYELASVHLRRGEPAAALPLLKEVLAREPANARATYQAALACDALADLRSAIEFYERTAALAPGRADIHNALAVAHHNFAQHGEALEQYRRALAIEPGFAEVHSNLLMALHYVEPGDGEAMFAEHLAWAARHAGGITPAARESFANAREPERRLRIGYVSPRFGAGPVSQNFMPLLQAHDHGRYPITCYSTSSVRDSVTEEIRSHADAWRDAWDLDDAELARVIRDDGIDILFDLSGHCPGHRLRVFARRAAPVQMTWLDYSSTTGLATMDYIVGDVLQTPVGTTQRFTEEVVRLPDTRLCYRPPKGLPDVVPPPAARNGYITFGCINRLSKLNPPLVATWSEILNAAPGSRLLLKGSAYSSAEVRDVVCGRFAVHGIAAGRLDLRGFSDEARMMAEYGDIDVCLDPHPYNGSTTTCDALTMGVPVVTLAGTTIASRAGVMFLTACGMPEWIGGSKAEYVRIACDAAGDVRRLAVLRQGLRERFLASPVCDGPRFARAFEEVCREAWRRFAAGR